MAGSADGIPCTSDADIAEKVAAEAQKPTAAGAPPRFIWGQLRGIADFFHARAEGRSRENRPKAGQSQAADYQATESQAAECQVAESQAAESQDVKMVVSESQASLDAAATGLRLESQVGADVEAAAAPPEDCTGFALMTDDPWGLLLYLHLQIPDVPGVPSCWTELERDVAM